MAERKKRPPHLEYELDAIENGADVARAAGIFEDTAIAGLLRMWRHCWRENALAVSAMAVRGFFGADITEALQTFGFLDAAGADGLYPVRGAERMLRVHEARSKGGQAAQGNLKRGTEPGQPRLSPGSAGAPAGSQPGVSRSSTPALQLPATSYQLPTEKETRARNVAAGPWVQNVFQHHRDTFGGKGSFIPPKDRDLIQARLDEGRSAEELLDAIDGFKANDWRVRKGLTKLSQILESDETVRIGIGWKHHPPDQEPAPPSKGRASEADRDWTRPIAVNEDGEAVL